jgi:hypothetical protein
LIRFLPWAKATQGSYVDINDAVSEAKDFLKDDKQAIAKATRADETDVEKIQEVMISNNAKDRYKNKKLFGTYWHKRSKQFMCKVTCSSLGDGTCSFGSYILKADAALAYDKAVEALRLEKFWQKNFIEFADYEKAREAELIDLESRGVCIDGVMSLKEAVYHIECMIAKKCNAAETLSALTNIGTAANQHHTRQAKRKAPIDGAGTVKRPKQ